MPIFDYINFVPLRRRKHLSKTYKMMTLDTETKDGLEGKEFFCGSIAYFSRKKVKIEQFHSTFYLYWFLQRIERKTVIYVHNLYFDLRFILKWEKHYGEEIYHKIVASGSNIIQYRLNKYVTLRDSFQFIRSKQEKAEKEFKVPPEWCKLDCPAVNGIPYSQWGPQGKMATRKHNRNDVKALLYIMQQFREKTHELIGVDAITKCSVASLSLAGMRVFMPSYVRNYYFKFDTDTKAMIEQESFQMVRSGFYGGRTEVIQRPEKDENMIYIDKNSLYPAQMQKLKFPVGKPLIYKTLTVQDFLVHFLPSDGIARVKVEAPPLEVPFLPVKHKGRLIFPIGEWIASYPLIELREAIKFGYKITDIEWCIIFPLTKRLFVQFVKVMNKEKMLCAKNGDTGKRACAKYLLMTNWGKLTQRNRFMSLKYKVVNDLEKEFLNEDGGATFKKLDEKGKWLMTTKEEQICSKSYMLPQIGAYICAGGRIDIYKAGCIAGWKNVFYLDTDSLVIRESALASLQKVNEIDDFQIGKMKVEIRNIKWFMPISPKMYGIRYYDEKEKKDITIVKIKGLDKENRAKFDNVTTSDEFLQLAKQKNILPARYESFTRSMQVGDILHVRPQSKKKYKCIDNKRVWEDEYHSKPIQLPEAIVAKPPRYRLSEKIRSKSITDKQITNAIDTYADYNNIPITDELYETIQKNMDYSLSPEENFHNLTSIICGRMKEYIGWVL